MGAWFKRQISRRHEVKIFDVDPKRSEGDLGELIEWCDMVMLATPFWETANAIRQLAQYNLENKVVFDIATFKSGIIEAYSALPEGAGAASVHPMFGPGADSIEGQKILTMEVPNRWGIERVEEFFSELGAEVVRVDAREHDEYVTVTVALSYAIGLALARLYSEMGPKLELYGGTSFKYLSTYAYSLLVDKNSIKYAEKAKKILNKFINLLYSDNIPSVYKSPEEMYDVFYKILKFLK